MPGPQQTDIVTEARELIETHSIVAMRVDRPYKEIRPLIAKLCDEVERLRGENADLVAANLSNLLSEIKERLTPEEGKEFQSLLMSATRGWVDEVTERSEVDRGLLEAFKDLPKRKKRQ